MTIELIAATHEDIPVLRRLMQFYLYDIASLDQWNLRDDGSYGNPERIETFWIEDDYHQFLIKVDGHLAGFALTSVASGETNEPIHVINEFFVLRRYRRSGVGRTVARRLFEGFHGTWRLSVMRTNGPAREFWATVIGGLTGKERHEFTAGQDMDEDVVFSFNTSNSSTGPTHPPDKPLETSG